MVHMQKKHGFFIPDVEYLKDPKGLLMRVGLKVNGLLCVLYAQYFALESFLVENILFSSSIRSKRDFTCLYCNDRRPSLPKFGGCEEASI